MQDQIRLTNAAQLRPFSRRQQLTVVVKASPGLAFLNRPDNSMPIRSPGPCLALWSGEGSERSHNGFRNHINCEQHLAGRFYLFRRDSNMARLSGTAAMTHLRFQISDLRDDGEAFKIGFSTMRCLRSEI